MSGLESIALAVAHLEEQRREQRQNQAATDASSSSSSDETQLENKISRSPPPPLSFGSDSKKAPRAVSLESIPSYDATSISSNSSTPPPTESSSSLLWNQILQDPASWLRAHESAKPIDPPQDVVGQISEHDVLCGRGGETNHHQGNIHYRNLVKAFQPLYIASKRREKPRIAQCIVFTVRKQGGRFLKRTDARSSTWADVGNTKAREKTSQALREGAPELRGEGNTNTTAGTPVTEQQSPSPLSMSANPNSLMSPQHLLQHSQQSQLPLTTAPVSQNQHPILTTLHQVILNSAAGTIPLVSPTSSFYSTLEAPSRLKRCFPSFELVSDDGDYDTPSDASSTTGTGSFPMPVRSEVSGGPRLKRLKLRCENSA